LEGVLDATRDRVLVFDDEDRGCHPGMLHRRGRFASRAARGTLAAATGRLATSGPAGEPQPRP
jgi:hypothetical protein